MYQPRSHVYSTGAISALVGLVLVLLFAPPLERDAHVMSLRTGDAEEILESMRRLCWIESGREELDAVLPELPLERRVTALQAARELGCLDLLAPQLRATLLVWRPADETSAEALVGLGAPSLMPAIEALDAPGEDVRQQAIYVLGALRDRMAPSTEERVVGLLRAQPPAPARNALLYEITGVPVAADQPLAAEAVAAEVVADALAIGGAALEATSELEAVAEAEPDPASPDAPAPEQEQEPLRLRPPELAAPEGIAPGGLLYVRPSAGDEPAAAQPEEAAQPDEPEESDESDEESEVEEIEPTEEKSDG